MTIKSVSKKLKEALFVVDEKKNTILHHNTIICINGYDFGDRLLEGVMFKAQLSEDRKIITVIGVSSPAYLEDLNAPKWMKEALKYFIDGADYVFSEQNHDSSDWVILTESALEEFYPKLFNTRFQ